MKIDTSSFVQIKEFTTFANRCGAESAAVAKLGDRSGDVNLVSHNTKDRPHGLFHWFRNSDKEAINNSCRQAFKEAIIKLFGGESKIPENVKTAMELDNFRPDSGKPLTARRICKIGAAIEVALRSEHKIEDANGNRLDLGDVASRLGVASKAKAEPERQKAYVSIENENILERISEMTLGTPQSVGIGSTFEAAQRKEMEEDLMRVLEKRVDMAKNFQFELNANITDGKSLLRALGPDTIARRLSARVDGDARDLNENDFSEVIDERLFELTHHMPHVSRNAFDEEDKDVYRNVDRYFIQDE